MGTCTCGVNLYGQDVDFIQEMVDALTKHPNSLRLLRWAMELVKQEMAQEDHVLTAEYIIVLTALRTDCDRAIGGVLKQLDDLRGHNDPSAPPASRAA